MLAKLSIFLSKTEMGGIRVQWESKGGGFTFQTYVLVLAEHTVPLAVNRHLVVGSQNCSDTSSMSNVDKELSSTFFFFLLFLIEVYLFP